MTSTDASGQDAEKGINGNLALPENKDVQVVAREHFNPTDVSVAAQIENINRRGPGAAQGGRDGHGDDNSNTQFATLALWVARRHGLPVDHALARIDSRFRHSQGADGGWGYRYAAGGGSHFGIHLCDKLLKPLAQSFPTANQTRLHCSQRNLQDVSDLFIGQAFDIAQHHGRAIRLGYLL